jgi:hypothetical protein
MNPLFNRVDVFAVIEHQKQELKSTLTAAPSRPPTLSSVAQTLHAASARQNGQKSLQFSFATKLLHMTNQHSPIYDSQVAAFYFFLEPERKPKDPNDLQRRISELVTFHDFLKQEYARHAAAPILLPSFRSRGTTVLPAGNRGKTKR